MSFSGRGRTKREYLRFDEDNSVKVRTDEEKIVLTDTSTSGVTYVGRSADLSKASDLDTAVTESIWQITREATEGSGFKVKRFADNEATYDKVWDDRTSLFPDLPFVNQYSINFDGGNDFVVIPDDATLNFGSSFTLSAWVKAPAQTFGVVISHWQDNSNRSWWLGSSNGSNQSLAQISLSGDGSTINKDYRSSLTVFDSLWHHVAFTWGSSTLKIYVDGVEDTGVATLSDTAMTTIFNSTADPLIGAQRASGGTPNFNFEGNVDEVSLWSVALSASEISEIYNSKSPSVLTDHSQSAALVSWYRMGDGDTFPTLTDNVGSNNGTMTNMVEADIEEDVP